MDTRGYGEKISKTLYMELPNGYTVGIEDCN